MAKNFSSNNSKKFDSGFTLIELLVVIAIIGLLASVVLVSLNGTRAKARFTKRMADIKQIQTALELYYDSNNAYPASGYQSQCQSWGAVASDQVIPGLVPTYMSKFPVDPSMNVAASTSCYIYVSNGRDYKLLDYNIQDTASPAPTNFIDPNRDSNGANCPGVDAYAGYLAIYTAGGACSY